MAATIDGAPGREARESEEGKEASGKKGEEYRKAPSNLVSAGTLEPLLKGHTLVISLAE